MIAFKKTFLFLFCFDGDDSSAKFLTPGVGFWKNIYQWEEHYRSCWFSIFIWKTDQNLFAGKYKNSRKVGSFFLYSTIWVQLKLQIS